MENTDKKKVWASIDKQIEVFSGLVYKELQEKNKRVDGTYMYQYYEHVIDGLMIARDTVDLQIELNKE